MVARSALVMRFNLATMARRTRNIRRPSIVLRDIVPPATLATNLFRSVYLPVVNAWSDGAERIIAEYERALSEMTTDDAADVNSAIDATSAFIARLLLTLTPELRNWALGVERWQRGKWRGAVLSATGVDLQTLLGAEDVRATLAATIEWNTALVKDVSDQARGRIGSAVFDGLRNRTPAREVAATIRESVAMSRRRSVSIASDQLSKLTSSLAAERRREAGLKIYKYRHSGKLHPRVEHKARDGKLYAETQADVGKTIDGQKVNAPIPANDRAGVRPWCGCREQGVIDFSDF